MILLKKEAVADAPTRPSISAAFAFVRGGTSLRVRAFVSVFFSLVFSIHAASLDRSVPKFISRYCMDCHDADTAKGDREFDRLLKAPNAVNQHEALKEILEQLNLGEMPPKKKRQPTDIERRAIVAELTRYLSAL